MIKKKLLEKLKSVYGKKVTKEMTVKELTEILEDAKRWEGGWDDWYKGVKK